MYPKPAKFDFDKISGGGLVVGVKYVSVQQGRREKFSLGGG